MVDARLQSLVSQTVARAPALVSWSLAGLLAIELGRVALTALGSSPLQTTPAPDVHRVAVPKRAPVDVQHIVGAHLFGVAGIDPTADPTNAPPTTASLVLAGTIASEDPKRGVAIISDGGPSKVYSVGQLVGGARVHSVYMDRVLLDRGGALESLLLPRVIDGSRSVQPQARAGLSPGGDFRTASAIENIRRRVQSDPGILYEVLRTVPSYDNKAGKLRGFRAYPGKNRTAFANLGLKPGDLVTAINGTPLDDPQRSQDVLNTIQTSEHATVTIERAGQRQDLSLNVAQIAQQASKDLEIDTNGSNAGTSGAAVNAITGSAAPASGAATSPTDSDD